MISFMLVLEGDNRVMDPVVNSEDVLHSGKCRQMVAFPKGGYNAYLVLNKLRSQQWKVKALNKGCGNLRGHLSDLLGPCYSSSRTFLV